MKGNEKLVASTIFKTSCVALAACATLSFGLVACTFLLRWSRTSLVWWSMGRSSVLKRCLYTINRSYFSPTRQDEDFQQENIQPDSLRALFERFTRVQPPDELPDSKGQDVQSRPDTPVPRHSCLQSIGQEGSTSEEQLDPERSPREEFSAQTKSEMKNFDKDVIENDSNFTSDTSIPVGPSPSKSSTVAGYDSSEEKYNRQYEGDGDKLNDFERRLLVVEAGLKETEAVTKMWSDRILQAEGELIGLHRQMYTILSTNPSEMVTINNQQRENVSPVTSDDSHLETLRNITAIIEETKNHVVQMSSEELKNMIGNRNNSCFDKKDDFNPAELPMLVRLPSLESIPVKDTPKDDLDLDCSKEKPKSHKMPMFSPPSQCLFQSTDSSVSTVQDYSNKRVCKSAALPYRSTGQYLVAPNKRGFVEPVAHYARKYRSPPTPTSKKASPRTQEEILTKYTILSSAKKNRRK